MKRKSLAIVASVIVVALVVVLALYFTGVIGDKQPTDLSKTPDVELTTAQIGVSNFNVGKDFTFDVISTVDLTSAAVLNNTVTITSNLSTVPALVATAKGDDIYTISAVNGYTEYASYKVVLTGAEFAGVNSGAEYIIFKIAGADKEIVSFNENVVEVSDDAATVEGGILTVTSGETYEVGAIISLGNAFYKIESGSDGTYIVSTPAVEEVFDELDVHVTDAKMEMSEPDEDIVQYIKDNLDIDIDGVEAQIRNSEYVQNAIALFNKNFDFTVKNVKIAFDIGYNDGDIILSIGITFVNVGNLGDITIMINNAYSIYYSVDYSLVPFTFDLDAKLVGTTSVDVTISNTISEKANIALKDYAKQLANCKGKLLDTLSTKVCKLTAPIGTTPLFFVYELTFESEIGIYGSVSLGIDFDVEVNAGVSYIDGDMESYASFDGSVADVSFAMLGRVNANATINNYIGISLANLADATVGVGVGVYGKLAGSLEADILSGKVVAGYYAEVGLYIPIKAKVNVVGIAALSDKTFNIKSWEIPFYSAGSQYVPYEISDTTKTDYTIVSDAITLDNVIASEALNLMGSTAANWTDTGVSLTYKDFNLEYDSSVINVTVDKKGVATVTLAKSAPSYFAATYGNAAEIKLISKYNPDCTYTLTVSKHPVTPTTLDADKDYDKNGGEDLAFVVLLNQTIFAGISGVDASAYSVAVDGNELTITFNAAYLKTLSTGLNTVKVLCSVGRNTAELLLYINVTDTTPATVEVDTYSFNVEAATEALFEFTLNGSVFEGLTDGEGNAIDATYYSVSNYTGNLKIYANYFTARGEGSYDFIAKTTYADVDLTVNVTDNRAPVLDNDTFIYNTAWGTDLEVTATLYSAEITAVTGSGIAANDYAIQESGVTLNAEFIATLANGTSDFVIVTTKGNLNFSLTIDSTAAFLVLTKSATFDLNAQKDVVYTFISDSGAVVSLANNNINANDYAVTNSDCNYVVTLKSTFVRNLSVGTYTFVLNCGTSNAILNLAVVDTTASALGESDFAFDKASAKDIEFSIALAAGDAIESVVGYGITLVDYSKNAGKVVINSAYLATLSNGTYAFEVITKTATFVVEIAVSDTRTPTATDIPSYSKTIGGTVNTIINIYGYAFVSIDGMTNGTDYLVSTSNGQVTITFQEEALKAMDADSYNITIRTTGGDIVKTLDINE